MYECFLTLVLTLAPLGAESTYDSLQITESCQSIHVTSKINAASQFVLTTEWMRYVIPLPQREDQVRLSYQLKNEYAYLGDCAYGLRPYHYFDSTCQAVVVRFGPKQTY